MEASEVLTLPEAARHMKMHPVTLRNMMHTKSHPPGRKVGGRWKFSRPALDAYLAGEKWHEAPTPLSPEARKARSTSATPIQAESAYFAALGLPTAPSRPSGRQSCTRKRTARAG
ncbi:helix-turn-helix domain-containing protein [Xanthomonas sontii]|uniref:Helix-turn-helix domain-containing protein n=1 Tax=Xanthomonas sontii TaxID=2650745 RepID=A0A6N7Q7B8_9XANT|nr:helix-turn-helix domain-containing protein [Xanthomonas sontii]MRH73389.1 helix-turn-helix domain-containing protein [Xanthomonas sontii]